MNIHSHEGFEVIHLHIHIAFNLHIAEDRRVVNQVVDLPEGFLGRIGAGNTRFLVAHIGAYEHRLSTLLANLRHHALALLAVQLGHHDLHPLGGAALGVALANALTGASNHHHFVVKAHYSSPVYGLQAWVSGR